MLQRNLLLLAVTLTFSGCDLIGDIFEAGLIVGIIIVLVVVAVVAWLFRMFTGRNRTP